MALSICIPRCWSYSVMNHACCKGYTGSQGQAQGNIGAILKKIMPAVNAAKKAKKDPDETLNLAVQENVKNTYKDIMKSKIVKELVHEGKLKIVAAEYYLGTGKVELIDLETVSKVIPVITKIKRGIFSPLISPELHLCYCNTLYRTNFNATHATDTFVRIDRFGFAAWSSSYTCTGHMFTHSPQPVHFPGLRQ